MGLLNILMNSTWLKTIHLSKISNQLRQGSIFFMASWTEVASFTYLWKNELICVSCIGSFLHLQWDPINLVSVFLVRTGIKHDRHDYPCGSPPTLDILWFYDVERRHLETIWTPGTQGGGCPHADATGRVAESSRCHLGHCNGRSMSAGTRDPMPPPLARPGSRCWRWGYGSRGTFGRRNRNNIYNKSLSGFCSDVSICLSQTAQPFHSLVYILPWIAHLSSFLSCF